MPASCIACGPDRIDQFRGAAGYIDRILKGEKQHTNSAIEAVVHFDFCSSQKVEGGRRKSR